MSWHLDFFLLAVVLMYIHELDAMERHEWRIFPGLSILPDEPARNIFVWIHLPLFLAINWYTAMSIASGGDRFSYWFSAFCIAHGFVHWAYERHPRCEFRNTQSRLIIWACAASGLAAIVFAH